MSIYIAKKRTERERERERKRERERERERERVTWGRAKVTWCFTPFNQYDYIR